MKKNAIVFMVIFVGLAVLASWPVNLVRFTQCDFKPPYKAEIIRGIGIPIFPVGMVAAYLYLGE